MGIAGGRQKKGVRILERIQRLRDGCERYAQIVDGLQTGVGRLKRASMSTP
jgi:hypothetical protein